MLAVTDTCYLVELKGHSCIVGQLKQPLDGTTVLIDVPDVPEWVVTHEVLAMSAAHHGLECDEQKTEQE